MRREPLKDGGDTAGPLRVEGEIFHVKNETEN